MSPKHINSSQPQCGRRKVRVRLNSTPQTIDQRSVIQTQLAHQRVLSAARETQHAPGQRWARVYNMSNPQEHRPRGPKRASGVVRRNVGRSSSPARGDEGGLVIGRRISELSVPAMATSVEAGSASPALAQAFQHTLLTETSEIPANHVNQQEALDILDFEQWWPEVTVPKEQPSWMETLVRGQTWSWLTGSGLATISQLTVQFATAFTPAHGWTKLCSHPSDSKFS